MSCYFVSAIDTGVGKSIATGLMTRYLLKKGYSAITFKPAQTGCEGIAEDILTHRELSGVEILPEDRNGSTCPYVFPVPASPHLSAELDAKEIVPGKIDRALAGLRSKFNHVLIEGAGGLMVPLTRKLLFIDWAAGHDLPLIMITSGRLGSINHTLLSLEAARNRNMKIAGIIYNMYPPSDAEISADSLNVIRDLNPDIPIVVIQEVDYNNLDVDFSPIFGDIK